MPTLVLASSIVSLYAVQVPLPVEMSALVMVGLILRWMVRREAMTDVSRDERIAALEAEVASIREGESEQRHLKHLVINQVTAMRGSLEMIKLAAQRCSCGAVSPVIPLIDNLLAKEA